MTACLQWPALLEGMKKKRTKLARKNSKSIEQDKEPKASDEASKADGAIADQTALAFGSVDKKNDAIARKNSKIIEEEKEPKASDEASKADGAKASTKKSEPEPKDAAASQKRNDSVNDSVIANRQPELTRFLYVHQPCSNAFFFCLLVTVLEIFAVFIFCLHNASIHNADAGITAMYKGFAANHTEISGMVDTFAAFFPTELLYLLARLIGSWVYIIFRSEHLYVLVKCIFSKDMKEFEFSIPGDPKQYNSCRIKFSLVLRILVDFVMIVGMCVCFVLTPSLKGLMADVSVSLNLMIIDDKVFWGIEKFCGRIPGLHDVKHTVKMIKYSENADSMRGAINVFVTSAVMFAIWMIDHIQTAYREAQSQQAQTCTPGIGDCSV